MPTCPLTVRSICVHTVPVYTSPTHPIQSMAASSFQTAQYPSTSFTESVGAIALNLSTRQILLVHYAKRDEWLLAKGRRNVGESRHEAALREMREEIGYSCNLLPLTMTTRAPPAVETGDTPEEARAHENVVEPFMLTCRHLNDGREVKLIWWYIAAIDESAETGKGEEQFDAQLFGFEEAVDMLTFETDREVVRRAIEIFEENER